jgi:cell division protein FtsN
MNSCNFFEEHPLFNKGPDSLLSMPVIEETEPEIIDTTPIIPEEPLAIQEPVAQTGYGDGRYFMIVGSFQNQNFAELYAEKIQEMGYESQIIEAPNGFYRVSARSYNNFQQGVNEIAEFRTSLTTGAWLHVK